jgi:hypothetical protein
MGFFGIILGRTHSTSILLFIINTFIMKTLKFASLILGIGLALSACNSNKSSSETGDSGVGDNSNMDTTGSSMNTDTTLVDTTNKGVSTGSGQGMGEGTGTNIGGASVDTAARQ